MPVNVTLAMVQQLLEQNASLLKQNEMLTATIAELNQTTQELKEQLKKTPKTVPNHLQVMAIKNLLLRVSANHPEKGWWTGRTSGDTFSGNNSSG